MASSHRIFSCLGMFLLWPCVLGANWVMLAEASNRVEIHPSDGPDVDLRLRLDADELVVTAIVNLAFCDEFLDIAREDDERLAKEEESVLFEVLGEVIAEKMKVAIDGIAVDALKTEFEALPVELSVLHQFPKFGMRAISRVRARFTYSLKSAPRSVGFSWSLYPDNLAIGERGVVPKLEIKSEWLVYGKSILVDLTASEPEHTWHNDGKTPIRKSPNLGEVLVPLRPEIQNSLSPWVLPLAVVGGLILLALLLIRRMRRISVFVAASSCLLVAAALWWQGSAPSADDSLEALPQGDAAVAIFEPLHANIYRAFDFGREEQVYDALSRSIGGEHLDEIYNQVYRGLVLQDQGGAVSRIQSVEMIEVKDDSSADDKFDDQAAFAVVAKWRVKGRVFHWGHIHWRTNEYRARYLIAPEGSAWKIVESRVLGQRRIPMEGDDPEGEGP